MHVKTTVVIVNFNSGEHLQRCLRSVIENAPDARVVVVDNSSTDQSVRLAESVSDRFVFHRNSFNAGFARAVNQGAATSDSEMILALNPDCLLQRSALDRMTADLEQHPECALVAPQVVSIDGSIQGNARGDPNMLTGLFGRSTLLTRWFPRSSWARRNVWREDLSSGLSSSEVNWVSGACMLIRRAGFEAVNGFDERYFLYWEDADLCRRLRNHGFTIRHVPSARVIHSGAQSSRTTPQLAIRAFHRSAYTYYVTHVAKTAFMHFLARFLLEGRCRWKLLVSRVAGHS